MKLSSIMILTYTDECGKETDEYQLGTESHECSTYFKLYLMSWKKDLTTLKYH